MKEDRKQSAKKLSNSVSKKMKKSDKKTKLHQVKSRFYYIFWGTCTSAVVLGQLYVGAGYREMAIGVNTLTGNINRIFRFVR